MHSGMRRLMRSLIKSLPALANVIIFLLFIFMLFGILGIQQYNGSMYYFCRQTDAPVNGEWAKTPDIERVCTADGLGQFKCPTGSYCGALEEYDIDLNKDNIKNTGFINYGITTFDNIGSGILTIFQIITLEGWVYIMYNHMDSNLAPFSAIYFCLLVVIGSFFMLNLIVAAIMMNVSDAPPPPDREEEERILEHLRSLEGRTADEGENKAEEQKKIELLDDEEKEKRAVERRDAFIDRMLKINR